MSYQPEFIPMHIQRKQTMDEPWHTKCKKSLRLSNKNNDYVPESNYIILILIILIFNLDYFIGLKNGKITQFYMNREIIKIYAEIKGKIMPHQNLF